MQFISDNAVVYATGSWRNRLTSETRIFLRFLRWEGKVETDLSRMIPKLPHWRLASVPRHLPWERVRALIGVGLPADSSDFGYLAECAKPKLFVQGTRDQYGSRQSVGRVG